MRKGIAVRIKVVRVKNKSNYTVKLILTIIVVTVLFKYYCDHKNVNEMHFLNTAKYKEIMGTEISLMSYVANESKLVKSGKGPEVFSFINDEIGVIKEVNSQNIINDFDSKDSNGEEHEETFSNKEVDNETVTPVQDYAEEPEVRPSNRSIGICNSRQIFI